MTNLYLDMETNFYVYVDDLHKDSIKEGDIYLDTNNILKIFSDGEWVTIVSGDEKIYI